MTFTPHFSKPCNTAEDRTRIRIVPQYVMRQGAESWLTTVRRRVGDEAVEAVPLLSRYRGLHEQALSTNLLRKIIILLDLFSIRSAYIKARANLGNRSFDG